MNSIPIREAARWLAAMAAADGVISPNERRRLKEFGEAYGVEPSSLYRMAYAIANNIEVPEVELIDPAVAKGRRFEEFIVKLTADTSRFKLLNWSSDKFIDGLYAQDTLLPDLFIRHRLDTVEVEYFIECKYRSTLPDGTIDLTKQLARYRRMIAKGIGNDSEPKRELFLAIGLGGTPSRPENLYIIPNRMIRYGLPIRIANFTRCLCPPTPDAFHAYISHYYETCVFRKQR